MTYRPTTLFCDVDRTLLTHSHELLPEISDAVQRLQVAGIRVILASARSPKGVEHILESLALSGPTICFNGAWTGDAEALVALQQASVSRKQALDVCRLAQQSNLVSMWYDAESVFALSCHAETAERQAAVTCDQLRLVEAAEDFPGDPLKVMVVTAPDRVEGALLHLRGHLSDRVSIVRSGPGLIEVVRADVNKARAAATLARQLNLSSDECAAAGDSDNDIEMLKWAGVPLTVANGTVEARNIASFVGGHCDEAGLSLAIDWLLALPPPESSVRGSQAD